MFKRTRCVPWKGVYTISELLQGKYLVNVYYVCTLGMLRTYSDRLRVSSRVLPLQTCQQAFFITIDYM